MTEITTEVKNRVVIFYDGTAMFITEAQEEAFFSHAATVAGGLKIDGNWTSLKAVSRIIGSEEYYTNHPEKRPAKLVKDFSAERDSGLKSGLAKEKNIRVIESMMRGMEGYIASPRYQGTDAPTKLLKIMQQRLTEVTASV